MTRTLGLALLLTLTACGKERDFVGDDLGDALSQADGTGAGTGTGSAGGTGTGTGALSAVDVPVLAPDDQCNLYDPGGRTLTLVGGNGTINVVHDGIDHSACAEWEIVAVADETTGVLTVTYEDVAVATCTNCWWTMDYILNDVPAGDWTVAADGDEESVTVQ